MTDDKALKDRKINFIPNYSPIDPQKKLQAIKKTIGCAIGSVALWGLADTIKCTLSTLYSVFRANLRETSDKKAPITILLITIYPDLARVWYHLAAKYLERQHIDKIIIIDSCGKLKPEQFPLARVVPFCNFAPAQKIDYFLRYEIDTPYVWLCDDDLFFISIQALETAYTRIAGSEKVAVACLNPRGWFLDINGEKHQAMGVYSILFSRDIFIREKLYFTTGHINDPAIGRISGFYDTGDFANEILIRLGYKVDIVKSSDDFVCALVGTTNALLVALRNRELPSSLREEIVQNPQLASYHIVGLFCDWKVAQLYTQIFSKKPEWLPQISENEIREIALELPDDFRNKTNDLFIRYENSFRILSEKAEQ
ncbi:MAG: hypothetical protein CVU44_14525 [Chloroflexi bacterium HGW-Chloroflexi-6]|nr:MAG: hypothetical protein CVU44_14525 [Chloroflexi bacterium HGW-Chloroflexi-6]